MGKTCAICGKPLTGGVVVHPECVPKWISVKDRLPEPETKVLIRFNRDGYEDITTALYEDGTINEFDSKWGWECGNDFEYDDENDCYIIPRGWWEDKVFNDDDEYNHMVDCPVTHWMPLPQPPKGA